MNFYKTFYVAAMWEMQEEKENDVVHNEDEWDLFALSSILPLLMVYAAFECCLESGPSVSFY